MVRIAWQKNLTLHPVLISGIINGRPFKFYTEFSREKYNNRNIQKFGNSVVVEFCVALTSVTNSRDIGSFWPVHSYWIQVYL